MNILQISDMHFGPYYVPKVGEALQRAVRGIPKGDLPMSRKHAAVVVAGLRQLDDVEAVSLEAVENGAFVFCAAAGRAAGGAGPLEAVVAPVLLERSMAVHAEDHPKA